MLARTLSARLPGHDAVSASVAGFLGAGEALLLLGSTAVRGESRMAVALCGPRAESWRQFGRLRSRVLEAACEVPGDRVLFVGGESGSKESVQEVLDVLTGRWEPLPPLRWARRACAVACLGSRTYVVGGNRLELERVRGRLQIALSLLQEEPDRLSPEDRQLVEAQFERPGTQSLDCANQIEQLDLEGPTLAWEPLQAPSGVALVDHAAVGCLGGQLVVAGGEVQGNASTQCWAYDPLRDAWEELPPLPEPRSQAGFCVHPRLGFVLAGGRDTEGEALSSAVALAAGTGGWRRLGDLGGPCATAALAPWQGSLVLLGGTGSALRYVEAEDRWEPHPGLGFRKALESMCALAVTAGQAGGRGLK